MMHAESRCTKCRNNETTHATNVRSWYFMIGVVGCVFIRLELEPAGHVEYTYVGSCIEYFKTSIDRNWKLQTWKYEVNTSSVKLVHL